MTTRYYAIELMGQGRALGAVTDHPGGGFDVQELRPDSQGFAASYYLGPCAIYRMHEVTEEVARATVDSGRVGGTVQPSWVAIAKQQPAVKPLPELTQAMLGWSFKTLHSDVRWSIEAVGAGWVLAEPFGSRSTSRIAWVPHLVLDLTNDIPF